MDSLFIFSFPGVRDTVFLPLLTDYPACRYLITPSGLSDSNGKPVCDTLYENSPSGINIFFLDSESAGSASYRDQVTRHLRRKGINLCLVDGDPLHLETEFLSQFHDFIVWPCCKEEFRARIDRYRFPEYNTPSPKDREILSRLFEMNLIGRSESFLRTAKLIQKVSQCDAPLLIRGETGTGKENAARAAHYLGSRADCGFIPINCGAIPDELLESELFGYQRGAFTDAKSSKKGLVEIAEGGTLFLDEIDSLSLKSQAALLRFLQSLEYRPLGAEACRRADVRVIAATNADLSRRVAEQTFREDLYFRINVLNITMPPLRDRDRDICLIAEQLINRFNQEHRVSPKRLSPAALRWLQEQPWPGNVREMENYLLREFLLVEGNVIHLGDCDNLVEYPPPEPEAVSELPNFQTAKAYAIREFEKSYLCDLLQLARGNVSQAARISGKERRALGKLIKKHSIDKAVYS